MAQRNAHGGQCCGMRHIHTFRDDQATNIRELVAKTTPEGDDRLQLEVILSDRQTRDNPRLVDELARLGYVYTSSWTGQHGTPVHLFLRAKRRLALTDANFYERWMQNNGMLPHPGLAGELPRMNERGGRANEPMRRDRYNGLLQGDRVRVNSPRSVLHGTEQVIRRFHYSGMTHNYYAIFEGQPEGRQIVVHNLERIVVEPAAPPAAPMVYRHPIIWTPPAARPAEQQRRLLLSQFYCVFRDSGNHSRVFATLAEGQAAFPRATQWHERKVYSDGEIVEGPVNHG